MGRCPHEAQVWTWVAAAACDAMKAAEPPGARSLGERDNHEGQAEAIEMAGDETFARVRGRRPFVHKGIQDTWSMGLGSGECMASMLEG